MVKTKICRKCKVELELSDVNFYKHKTGKDGFRNDCKNCRNKIRKEYYSKNKSEVLEKNKIYREQNKTKISIRRKEYREKNKEILKQKHMENKEHKNEISRKYYYENREERLEKARRWKKENNERNKEIKRRWYKTPKGKEYAKLALRKRRERNKGSDFKLKDWESCIEHFESKCAYCGLVFKSLEMDHFIPLSKGGLLTKNNVVPACRTCNATKHAQDFFEWFPNYKYYSVERENKILSYLGRDQHDSLQIQ